MIDIKTIKKRKSVRTYDNREIPTHIIYKLNEFIPETTNPFDMPVEIRVLNAKEYGISSPVVTGANVYAAAKTERGKYADAAVGYSFEKFILYATWLGLGTVWLAGTLSRHAFERAMEVKKDEVMPAATPLGFAADKMTFKETRIRKKLKADERLPFEKLFFNKNFDTPLSESDAGKWLIPLEMVRIAPSAANKQPWRLVVTEDAVHFYEKKSKGFESKATGDVQMADIGIGMCHFEIAAQEGEINGRFVISDPGLTAPKNTEYIATFSL